MTLLAEIQTKCTPALIASRDEAAIAATVSIGRTKLARVPIADLQDYLQTRGLWWAIKTVAANTAHVANASAVAVMDVANARYTNIDMTFAIVGQMLGGLVAAGIITQADMDAMKAKGTVPDPVSAHDVAQALGA